MGILWCSWEELRTRMRPVSPDTALPDASLSVHSEEVDFDELAEICRSGGAVAIYKDGQWVGVLGPREFTELLLDLCRSQRAFFEQVLDIVQEAVTVIDRRGVVRGWSRTAEQIYDIPAQRILGRPIDRFFQPEALAVLRLLRDPKPVRQVYHAPRENTHVLLSGGPAMVDGQMAGAVASEKDITQLVRMHQELQRTYRQWMADQQLRHGDRDPFDTIKGGSSRLLHAIRLAKKVAPTDATVLLQGESGVGKDLFAQAIHAASRRSAGPFIALNCAAIPGPLFESELFGYQGGAFTGADRSGRPGKLELAHGGTLFLDEIGELPVELQAKFLRVLQDQTFYRIGGTRPIQVNARIIAAGNQPLEDLVAKGRFREDLYYRLNVVRIFIPPLRERLDDIPVLVETFLEDLCAAYGRPAPHLEPDFLVALMRHPWSGNVRELRNVLERLVVTVEDESWNSGHLAMLLQAGGPEAGHLVGSPSGETAPQRLGRPGAGPGTARPDGELILEALRKTGGNKAAAARLLGISRGTLYNRLRSLGLDPQAFDSAMGLGRWRG
ncbi:sigma-54 interaction domain-containing protein [Kyrpidia spormannii]|uniref:Sigma-54-dependent Fis family transcriptional regulator n=2 Tax=Kyrpidia spormannii TaxID=2055160 RepID=A0ACA8Z6U4_9BACL|nr:sigma 54-interacting transcriptional regulator [Kyrpidia spormannii]CAB3389518.1 Sigma-54-dependent Fis family transcriptional regulator [Kyrpidia spormannii]CAB3390328.1 Sigma-54-dependent Fis family transcriptional regulator [Kyrpidia spormannii]